VGWYQHTPLESLKVLALKERTGHHVDFVLLRVIPDSTFNGLPQIAIVVGILRHHVGQGERLIHSLGAGHIPRWRHVAAIEAAADIIGELSSLVGRKVGVGVEIVDPIQDSGAACSPGGEMLGHPKRCPGNPRVEQRKLRITDLPGLSRELWIGKNRNCAVEEVLRARCRCSSGGDEKQYQTKDSKGVKSHRSLMTRASLDRSIPGPFQTSKAPLLRSMLSLPSIFGGVFRLEVEIRRSP
jgi:hypothetical protein